jgi:glutamate synthase (NADPH/NADH) large chain
MSWQLGATTATSPTRRSRAAMALVHQRFSTNTFPSWKLAHPYRLVAHNGEINTLSGNVNWMAARQASVIRAVRQRHLQALADLLRGPVGHGLLRQRARIPRAGRLFARPCGDDAHPRGLGRQPADGARSAAPSTSITPLMEPWDGPAAMSSSPTAARSARPSTATACGPARYMVTEDGLVMIASEWACCHSAGQDRQKWRLQPGKHAADRPRAGAHHLRRRDQVDARPRIPTRTGWPAPRWCSRTCRPCPRKAARSGRPLLDRQQAFGYTQEDLKLLMAPMAVTGQEAVGSMGTDTPISALSDRPKLLYTYFKQNFAQVTNPPIDPIREELGDEPRLLHRAAAEPVRPQGHCRPQAPRSAPAHPHQ